MRRRIWIVLFALVVVAAAGGYFAWNYRQDALAAQQNQGRRVAVRTGTLVATVSASGSIAPEAQVALNFQTPGTVDKVNVVVGQKVKAGAVLAQLDTAELALAVQQAYQAYVVQQVTYSQTLAGPKAWDVAAAKAQLDSALAQYADIKSPDDSQVAQALAQLKKAQNDVKQAEDAYEGVAAGRAAAKQYGIQVGGLGQAEEQMRAQLQVIRAARDAAQASYDRVARGATDAQLVAAWAAIQQAQANLDRLTPDQDRIAIGRAQLEQARVAYEQAKLRLDRATLTAPFDGQVGQVNITRGGSSTAPGGAVLLVDDSLFHLDVSVDEIDIAKLQIGQTVTVSVDALPEATLTGKIDRISPVATTQAGVVSYQVRINVDATSAALPTGSLWLRAGMSANVTIVTDTRPDVLLVPNWAIRIDRATGKAYVNRLAGNQVSEVEVKTGLRNETDSEVLSGVQEGDVIIVGGVTGLSSLINQASQ
jgi:HlyD family secretion protein